MLRSVLPKKNPTAHGKDLSSDSANATTNDFIPYMFSMFGSLEQEKPLRLKMPDGGYPKIKTPPRVWEHPWGLGANDQYLSHTPATTLHHCQPIGVPRSKLLTDEENPSLSDSGEGFIYPSLSRRPLPTRQRYLSR